MIKSRLSADIFGCLVLMPSHPGIRSSDKNKVVFGCQMTGLCIFCASGPRLLLATTEHFFFFPTHPFYLNVASFSSKTYRFVTKKIVAKITESNMSSSPLKVLLIWRKWVQTDQFHWCKKLNLLGFHRVEYHLG